MPGNPQSEQSGVSDVTVIIPAYNASQYIARSLRSLSCQQFQPLKVVVIDDGSTDKTADRARSVASELGMPVEILRQPNMGVSEARNAGLELASTKYVMFLDADDYIDPQCILLLHGAAETESAEMAFCGFDRVDRDGRVIWEYTDTYQYPFAIDSGDSILCEVLALKTYINMGVGLYNREFLERHHLRFWRGCTAGEDEEFIFKALSRATIVACVPRCLHHYSVTPGSASRTRTMRRFDWVSALRRLQSFMSVTGASPIAIRLLNEYYLPRVVIGVAREVSSSCLSYVNAVRLCRNKAIRRMVAPLTLTSIKDVRQLRVQRAKAYGLVYYPHVFVLAAQMLGLLGR